MRNGSWISAGLVLTLVACSDGGSGGPPTGGGNNTPGSISGRVIDADSANAGVGGVNVVLASGSNQQTVTTTGTGAFSLGSAAVGAWTATLQTPATHRLNTGETGSRSLAVASGQNATLADFVLVRPRGSLTGSVQESGTAVSGGSVAVTRGGFSARNATPANGTYTVANLPVGSWSLQYTPPTSLQLATGETGTRTAVIAEGQATTVSVFQLRQPPPQSGVVEIHLTSGSTFAPGVVTITVGTTVRFINDGPIEHTVTPENATQPGVWTRHITSTAGTVFEHTFTVANQTYRYRCEPHSVDFTNGMVGSITVTP